MKLFLFLTFLVTGFAVAQTTYQLQGKIGSHPVYMFISEYPISENDSAVTLLGQYFYVDSLHDIRFRGYVDSDEYVMSVEGEMGEIAESFKLIKIGEKFKGTWQNMHQETLDVTFEPIDINLLHLESVRRLKIDKISDYDFARLSFVELQSDSISKIGNKSFEWFSEKHCRAPFFRLSAGFSDEERKRINPILENIHLRNISEQLSCSGLWGYNDDYIGIDYKISIDYLDHNLLGFKVFMSFYCGGAHPDFSQTGYLIDLNNGLQYELTDVYDFTVEELYQLLFEKYNFKKPDDVDDFCDYTDIDVWTNFSWALAKDGVMFTPMFVRVARACDSAFFIPFSDLKPYQRKSFLYHFNSHKDSI